MRRSVVLIAGLIALAIVLYSYKSCTDIRVGMEPVGGNPAYTNARICLQFSIQAFWFAKGRVPDSADDLVRWRGAPEYEFAANGKILRGKLTPSDFSLRVDKKSSREVTFDIVLLGYREEFPFTLKKKTKREVDSTDAVLRNLKNLRL